MSTPTAAPPTGPMIAEPPTAADPPAGTITAGKIIDIMLNKQSQYYGLWAVYTAVQFTAGSFGGAGKLPLAVAVAVLIGVWIFNVGHLSFVLNVSST